MTANCLHSSCVFLHSCLFTSSACPVFLSPLFFYLWLSTPPATSHFFFSSPLHQSPLLYLTSPLLSSSSFPLLPLFRLCKVQLGFGAFGPQAWRQEDALSEYALLGSLCVTLYFFALLFFTRRRWLLLLFPFTPVSVAVVLWVSSSFWGSPYPRITSVSAENWHRLYFIFRN